MPASESHRLAACLLLAALGLARAAAAEEPSAPAAPGDFGALDESSGCSEPGMERKGVQRRDFLKRHRLEVSAWGGFFAGDLLSTSYAYGGALAFFLSEDFGVEASLVVSPFSLGIERPLTQLFGGQRFGSSFGYILVGDLLWSPVHLKVRASERSIVHGDLAFVLGAGDTFHDSVQGVTLDVGLALKLYPTRWLALRIDVRDYLMVQEAVAVQRVANNVIGLAGLSVFLPGMR
jgi:outer membrane beta-barrel protein